MNTAPKATQAASVLEIRKSRERDIDICCGSDARLDYGRTPGHCDGPSQIIRAEEATAGLCMSRAEARRTRRILWMIGNVQVTRPLGAGHPDCALAGAAPCADLAAAVEIVNGREGSNRIVPIFVVPRGDAAVECGKVGEEIVVYELIDGEIARLRYKQRREPKARNLVVEQLGRHLLNIRKIGRSVQYLIGLLSILVEILHITLERDGRHQSVRCAVRIW